MRSAACCQGCFHGVLQEGIDGDGVVVHLVDEGGVGAVFQQAAREIGKQSGVRADRSINAAEFSGVLMDLRV